MSYEHSTPADMADKTPLQLMDLPYDILEEIFIILMQIDWTGADFAICSKATLIS